MVTMVYANDVLEGEMACIERRSPGFMPEPSPPSGPRHERMGLIAHPAAGGVGKFLSTSP